MRAKPVEDVSTAVTAPVSQASPAVPTVTPHPQQTASRIIHYKPFGWVATGCRLSPLKFPALVYTRDPDQVDCVTCLRVMRDVIGVGALNADALREITAITLDIATKRDLSDLKAFIEVTVRELIADLRDTSRPRYMGVRECAAYLGRSVSAVRHLVSKNQIPHGRIGYRIEFDKEKVDSWVARHARRGSMV